jgi:prolyl 4-hydroxylase
VNQVHHDYIFDHKKMPCGPRILTAFIYMNDVEEGGATYFPQLNITVRPKVSQAGPS